MKNLKTFEDFKPTTDDLLDEGLMDMFKNKFSAKKFKTVLAYYHKMNNEKNIKYWLNALVTAKEDKLIEAINNQYNKLKPKFVAFAGGGTASNEGHEDLLKQIDKNEHVFDSMILDDIDNYIPNKKNDVVTKLNIKAAAVKESVQPNIEGNIVKSFDDFQI